MTSTQPFAESSLREIQESDAKTDFLQLLDDVEQGESVVITRHGRPIAQLVPDAEQRQAKVRKAIEDIRALGRKNGKVTVEEILSSRHEGHKY